MAVGTVPDIEFFYHWILAEFFDLLIEMREGSFKRLPMIWIGGVLQVVLDACSR